VIAALFVATNGCYFNLPEVDPWDEARDARLYTGPWPVVAHPPCARWSRLAGFCESRGYGKRGHDAGCFVSALAAVRWHGGVLEHPAFSAAWEQYGLARPRREGGWSRADRFGGWTCHVDQARYGHLTIKPTWLYTFGTELPELTWGEAEGGLKLVSALPGSSEKRRRMIRTGAVQRLSRGQRIATPVPFRDLLLDIARSAQR
jgi:hypothetical protein